MSLDFFKQQISAVMEADRQACQEAGVTFVEPTILGFRSKDLVACIVAIKEESDATRFFEGYVSVLGTLDTGLYSPQERACMAIAPYLGFDMPSAQVEMWQGVVRAAKPSFQAAK